MRKPKSILVAYDYSGTSRAALAEAKRIARASDSTLVLFHALTGPEDGRRSDLLSCDVADAQSYGIACRLRLGPPPVRRALTNAIEAERPDLVVMGASRGKGRLARRVLRSGLAPVLAVRDVPHTHSTVPPVTRRRIVVGVELDGGSMDAVDEAARFAALAGGEIRLVHATSRADAIPSLQHRLDWIASTLRANGLEASGAAVFGDPARALIAETEGDRGSVIAVGTRHRSTAARRVLGSVAEKVLAGAPGAVLIAPVSGEGIRIEAPEARV